MINTTSHDYAKIVKYLQGFQEFLEQRRQDSSAAGLLPERFEPLFFNESKILMGLYGEMIVATKLESDGHDVYSYSLKGKADIKYWTEAHLPEAKTIGLADLYIKDIQKWVEVKISKSYTSPKATTNRKKRPFSLWSWNHQSIKNAANAGNFDFVILIGINSLDNYLGKPEDFCYWILSPEEALQIETFENQEQEKTLWFYLADDPDKIKDRNDIPWAPPVIPIEPSNRWFTLYDFHEKQFRRCKEWSNNPSMRVTYQERWTKVQ